LALVGKHCLLELGGCSVSLLNDLDYIQGALREASEVSGATVLHVVTHQFEPQGVTALGLLSESHISLHTWPENGYAAADIFTCGDTCDPERACEYLVSAFEASEHSLLVLPRGSASGFPSINLSRPSSPREMGVTEPQNGGPKVKDVSCPEAKYAQTSG
jgi:S-adenosylmethionine decarboxylase